MSSSEHPKPELSRTTSGLQNGDIVDSKLRIKRLLSKGGMSAVYLAEHMLSGKLVAVKFLLAEGPGVSLKALLAHA